MGKSRKARIPKLRFTQNRGIGWHVSYRDLDTGMPRRHRFGISEQTREEEALAANHRWLGEHLNGDTPDPMMQDRELSYVQISRARASTPVFLSEAQASEDLVAFAQAMERGVQKNLIHDGHPNRNKKMRLTSASLRLRLSGLDESRTNLDCPNEAADPPLVPG